LSKKEAKMPAEVLKFRLSKFLSAFVSGIVLGVIFSIVAPECPACVRKEFPFIDLLYFLIAAAIIFLIIWVAHSFVISLKD
jgi:hypothetical protein